MAGIGWAVGFDGLGWDGSFFLCFLLAGSGNVFSCFFSSFITLLACMCPSEECVCVACSMRMFDDELGGWW